MSDWTVDAAEVVQIAQTRLGRPVSAFDAVLGILEQNLPAALTAINALHAGTEADPLPFDTSRTFPKAYRLMGEDMGSADNPNNWPQILVGGSTSIEDLGHGWKDEVVIQVTVAWPPQFTRREFQEALDVASIVQAVLVHPNFQGFRHPTTNGVVWSHIFPTGFRPVPADWQRYSGWIATFTARQTPNSQLW